MIRLTQVKKKRFMRSLNNLIMIIDFEKQEESKII